MASWMVHLRIADKLLDLIPELSPIEFIVGNIAPDSGVPNEDWSKFSPSTTVSHFRRDHGGSSGKNIDFSAFTGKYFTPAQQLRYTGQEYSFFLGYLVHLLTDQLWSEKIARPSFRKYIGEDYSSRHPLVSEIKRDWYDLDFKYLREHPGFRAFRVYLGCVGFVNTFMDEFASDAFDNRRAYITGFYLEENDHIERDYPYLTQAQMDAFVTSSVAQIPELLKQYCVR